MFLTTVKNYSNILHNSIYPDLLNPLFFNPPNNSNQKSFPKYLILVFDFLNSWFFEPINMCNPSHEYNFGNPANHEIHLSFETGER